MNITFLVGNGFDISAGLHTGYGSFYEWYCDLPGNNQDSLNIQKFKQSIREYIDRVRTKTDFEIETWADFELGLGEYTDQFSQDTGNDFLQCREDAFNKMIEYLKKEQDKFDIEKLSDDGCDRIRTQLGNFYSALLPAEAQTIKQLFDSDRNQQSIIRFISFNYTDVLDQVVDKISNFPVRTWEYGSVKLSYRIDSTVLHVHGKLDEYPILAVHDESQIKKQDLLSTVGFRESMIKSAGIQAMGRDWYSKATNIIDNSRIICIFGMSLGATDRKWWERILTWLSGSSARHLVIFQHLDIKMNKTSISQYVINKSKVIDKLFSYSDLPKEKKELIKNRIYVAFNVDNVLQIKEESRETASV